MVRIIFTVILLLCSFFSYAENASFASYTRETDYTIGSVAHQYLTVSVPKGYRLDEGSIPEKGVTEAIELRSIEWDIDESTAMTRYHFRIDWQIFVAAETVKSVPLRSLSLVFKRNKHAITIEIPPDSVLVSNLLPPKMDAKHVMPYPDITPPRASTVPFILLLCLALGLFVISSLYVAWYLGWIRLPMERRMPFRKAWRSMRGLNDDTSSTRQAMQMLSHAFNHYAGFCVTRESMPRMLSERSLLAPFQQEITQFYDDMQLTFFAGQSTMNNVGSLKVLAKKMSRIELS